MLATLQPVVIPGDYVFCTLSPDDFAALEAVEILASFRETEGVTAILEKTYAETRSLRYDGVFSGITLGVYSSLEAVGLTAAVANALAQCDIPANVIAAYHHDHLFVPAESLERALQVLMELGNSRLTQ